jgi:tetrahydromethanopterin S-methyltransferase subunit B|tara:strand:- start:277 stop:459 length:183 start_codon:yes stop_codon:yes gene_type:complete
MVSDKQRIMELEERLDKLESIINDFMKHWGPDVQKRRAKRDEVWDEMVRVVSIQNKNKER